MKGLELNGEMERREKCLHSVGVMASMDRSGMVQVRAMELGEICYAQDMVFSISHEPIAREFDLVRFQYLLYRTPPNLGNKYTQSKIL